MLRRRPDPVIPDQAFTAASTKIDVNDEKQAREQKKRPQEWQKQAWRFYDEIGEVRFAARYMSDGLAKLRLFPAVRDDPEQPPVPVSEADKVDPSVLAACTAVTDRLKGSDGTHAELLRGAGLNIFVAGEGNLVGGKVSSIDADRESWNVFSVEELVADPARTGSKYSLKPSPDAKRDEYVDLDPNTFVLRIWRRHPLWSAWPDSAMRGGLDLFEELAVLTQMVMASARTRLSAGLIGIPSEASYTSTNPQGQPGDNEADAFTAALIEHFTTPISDRRSAASVVPFILRASSEDLGKMIKWDFSRDIDKLAIELRGEIRRRIATIFDMPPEILSGMADINHWGAWQIKEEADREVLNLAELIIPALTRGYFQPSLAAMGVEDPERYFLWYDPAALVSHPNEQKVYAELFDKMEVSGDAYRRASAIPDEDKPTDEERQRRIEEYAAMHARSQTGPVPISAVEGTTEPEAGPPEKGPTPVAAPPTVEQPVAAAALPALPQLSMAEVAALAEVSRPVRNVGRTLADTERGLRSRIQAAADAAMRRGLEKAGARLINMARKDPTLRKTIEGVDATEIASVLGRGVVESLADSNTPDVLLAGSFDALHARYELWVANAQREGARELRRKGPREPSDAELERLDRQMTSDRYEGWSVLEAGLLGIAAERLYAPNVEPPTHGEYDSTSLVPAGIIRSSLQRAGGGPRDGSPVGGALLGQDLYDFATASGLELGDQFEWVHGGADRPFEPHLELSGEDYSGWTDDRLTADEDWLGVDFYYPGDHDGCTCEAVPFYTPASEAVSTGARGNAAPD